MKQKIELNDSLKWSSNNKFFLIINILYELFSKFSNLYIYIFGKVSKIKNFDEELWTQ